MIVGSGLIATAFADHPVRQRDDLILYAAGVSNSRCNDPDEYRRDRQRLEQALAASGKQQLFVYFSTCSIGDPALHDDSYVTHKLAMEALVGSRGNHAIFRLPQVAGRSPNPHTLLNFLHSRITRSERFQVWGKATRNIIDVQDVVRIALDLIASRGITGETINIANPISHPVPDIVREMETVLRMRADYELLDKGSDHLIDTGRIAVSIRTCGLAFDDRYLGRIIGKYYGAAHAS